MNHQMRILHMEGTPSPPDQSRDPPILSVPETHVRRPQRQHQTHPPRFCPSFFITMPVSTLLHMMSVLTYQLIRICAYSPTNLSAQSKSLRKPKNRIDLSRNGFVYVLAIPSGKTLIFNTLSTVFRNALWTEKYCICDGKKRRGGAGPIPLHTSERRG